MKVVKELNVWRKAHEVTSAVFRTWPNIGWRYVVPLLAHCLRIGELDYHLLLARDLPRLEDDDFEAVRYNRDVGPKNAVPDESKVCVRF
jgi:hypothetical protein